MVDYRFYSVKRLRKLIFSYMPVKFGKSVYLEYWCFVLYCKRQHIIYRFMPFLLPSFEEYFNINISV